MQAMPGCIKGKFKRNLTAKTGRVGRSSHGNRNQNPKKRFFKVVSRSIAGLVFSTGALCGWQYYRLRRDYVPLKPPKGAVSGIETPLRITEGKDENNLEECQIFFIGDSLVIGIGCPDRLEGPVFARHISRVVAQALQKKVKWRVMGIDGGDVKTMREKLLVQVEKATRTSDAEVSAVVIMCGLNDYKCLIQEGRLPSMFKEELRNLIRAVKNIVGDEARVVLPALPVERAPLFQTLFPMNVMLYKVAKIWDHQKLVLSGEEQKVEFVDEPGHYNTGDWAVDGIHPSEQGYTRWADHIVISILPRLKDRVYLHQTRMGSVNLKP